MIAWLVAKGLARLNLPALLADTLGIASAVAAHLLATGPLWDRLFWGGGLIFSSVLIPVAIACGLYLFYRLAFGFVLKLRTTEPKSLP
ncbi:hypothetical protein [uncultured Erythrobacter sp.]|uniref:hypothetical protein n=1 Tax=uncultured Erythrobacter sp. TaxID=263913 RepID=UPI002616D493|nr:hypothetical protein [uncultured Erythrobacter sp.]